MMTNDEHRCLDELNSSYILGKILDHSLVCILALPSGKIIAIKENDYSYNPNWQYLSSATTLRQYFPVGNNYQN